MSQPTKQNKIGGDVMGDSYFKKYRAGLKDLPYYQLTGDGDGINMVEEYIAEQPFESCVICFSAGMLQKGTRLGYISVKCEPSEVADVIRLVIVDKNIWIEEVYGEEETSSYFLRTSVKKYRYKIGAYQYKDGDLVVLNN